jgi:ATP-dependent DNA ligase
MQIEPQPARGTLREEMWDDPNWIAEEKYDGDRRIAQFCGRVVRFTGRRKSVDGSGFVEKTENVPHLSGSTSCHILGHKHLSDPPPALDGTVLDGEMIATQNGKTLGQLLGGMSKYVTSIMGSLPEEAVRKQIERGWLRYVVFDCLFWKGEDIRDLPLDQRQKYAACAVRTWDNEFARAPLPANGDKREYLRQVLARGGEGIILKHVDHRYGDKQGWVKVKAEWKADVVIMGYVPAKEMSKKVNGEKSMTKYAKAGLIGAIRCGQLHPQLYNCEGVGADRRPGVLKDLVEVATVSGMDDGLRERLSKHGLTAIGKVIEIAHNGREPTGRFRHPRFKRFRDDKQAKDCTYREGEI